MEHVYYPRGVCSRRMELKIEDGIIKKVGVVGGCNGNLQGLCSLLEGMRAEDAVKKMKGIRCGLKATSCPDQLSLAIEEAMNKA